MGPDDTDLATESVQAYLTILVDKIAHFQKGSLDLPIVIQVGRHWAEKHAEAAAVADHLVARKAHCEKIFFELATHFAEVTGDCIVPRVKVARGSGLVKWEARLGIGDLPFDKLRTGARDDVQ